MKLSVCTIALLSFEGLILLILLIMVLINIKKKYFSNSGAILFSLCALAFASVAPAALIINDAYSELNLKTEKINLKTIYEDEIFSFSINSEISGKFVLGCGYINEKYSYAYYAKEYDAHINDYSLSLKYILADNVKFVEDLGKYPEKDSAFITLNEYVQRMYTDVNNNKYTDKLLDKKYYFHLPKGYITESF